MDARSASAISEYPDVDAIGKRIADLVRTPPRRLTEQRREAYRAWFDEHCPSSKRSAAEAERYIPGGVQHNLALNEPFALEAVRAEGAYLWDADGNRYIDFLQAGGPTVLGSNHPAVREKVFELLSGCGPVTGLLHRYEIELAK